jgi:hypothetical protein
VVRAPTAGCAAAPTVGCAAAAMASSHDQMRRCSPSRPDAPPPPWPPPAPPPRGPPPPLLLYVRRRWRPHPALDGGSSMRWRRRPFSMASGAPRSSNMCAAQWSAPARGSLGGARGVQTAATRRHDAR